MEDLRLLLIKNQTNLDRLRARARYLFVTISNSDFDTRKQFGPYSEFWEDWHDHAESLLAEMRADILATAVFCNDLREFVIFNSNSKIKNAVNFRTKNRNLNKMIKLAEEAITYQLDMLKMANFKILEHREFTNKLLLVEAIDNLNED